MTGLAEDKRPAVPQVGDGSPKQRIDEICKIPPWLAVLPPGVEPDYRECVNKLNHPSSKLAETMVKEFISREAKLVKVEPALEFFARVYRVQYMLGGKKTTLLCDEKITYCVPDKPVIKRNIK